MMARLFPLAIAVLALLAACGGRPSGGPVVVSVIGESLGAADPSTGRALYPQRVVLDATAQGLVRLDASGQVEPGLAQRWITIDNGTSWIFRLGSAEWPDGQPVTAGDVVAVLDRARAPDSRNPMAGYLANVEEMVAMTPEIVEVRLRRPIPSLLALLATPDLAIVKQRTLGGSGPMRVAGSRDGALLLKPAFDPGRSQDEDAVEPGQDQEIELRAERAARAIARFQMKRADLVEGGSWLDWPLLGVAGVPAAAIRTDPAAGLFGLAITTRQGFLADAENRAALAMAIDRASLTAAFRPDWSPIESVLPEQLDMAASPAAPDWAAMTLDQRRIAARARVDGWRARHPGAVPIRIALPPGPGSVLVWNRLYQDFRAIGLWPRRVGPRDTADLRLIDRVAPVDNARWYLTVACRLCSDDTITLVAAARDAPDLDARAQRLSEADAMLARDAAYIPIARPLRWSLVTQRLDAWQRNPRAWHPLNRLRNEGS